MDFTSIVNAVVLGIVEGLTEFLPISSTGHLVIFNEWFRFESPGFTNTFNFVIQSGAILAVVLFFRKRLFPFYRTQTSEQRSDIGKTWLRTLIGFLPAVIAGLALSDFMDQHLLKPVVVAAALIVWGVVIILVERRNNTRTLKGIGAKYDSVASMSISIVLCIGLIQCLAIVPGTSRSAATIIGAMLLGASRVAAAEFSFFLAIPTLIGAGVYSLYKELKSGISLSSSEILTLVVGTAVAFAVAYAVVAFFMRFIQRRDFQPFGWYRIVVGIAVIVYFLVQGRLFEAVAS